MQYDILKIYSCESTYYKHKNQYNYKIKVLFIYISLCDKNNIPS
jgi:hypothetical protein